jgi:trans-aconitate 2-methyltransferase
MTDVWKPAVYATFSAERRQPFDDLLSLVAPVPGGRVLDLGCGTGELTRVVHERMQARETVGVDRSAAMLERSAPGGGVRFERGDLGAFASSQPFDVLFSNAALHWLPDHPALLERLGRLVAPGGQLAVQVPANFDHPSHRTADEVAREAPFAGALGGWTRGDPVLDPRDYAALLHRLGWQRPHVRLVVYPHLLASREAVVDWVKGTTLTVYEERLGPLFPAYLERYRALLMERLPDERPYFYGFKRILMWARRPS